jgi:hypothetical protein
VRSSLLHIDTRVEISTLGEPNNAQFFLNLKVVRFIASSSGTCEPPIIQFVSFGLPICSVTWSRKGC